MLHTRISLNFHFLLLLNNHHFLHGNPFRAILKGFLNFKHFFECILYTGTYLFISISDKWWNKCNDSLLQNTCLTKLWVFMYLFHYIVTFLPPFVANRNFITHECVFLFHNNKIWCLFVYARRFVTLQWNFWSTSRCQI